MYKIALIGGGPAAVSFCIQLYEQLKNTSLATPIEIVVFEKSSVIGPGLPYSHKCDSHLINLPKGMMEPVYGMQGQFAQWLTTFPGYSNQSDFPPRYYFGQYLEYLAKKVQKDAETIGVKITYRINSEVSDIKNLNTGKFEIKVKNETHISDFIILCTGHMPSPSYRELIGKKGYWHNPWNFSVKKLDQNENIGIIGTRLTAIDIVRKLNSENYQGKFFMASRTGLFPTVLSKNIPTYPLRYLTLSTIVHLTKSGLNPLMLSDLLALFWKEVSEAQGYPCDFNSILKSHNDVTPSQWLNQEIRRAEEGPKPWQQVLFSLYPAVPTLWSMLSLSDQTVFMEKYYSLFLTYLAAFPLENAYKMREILKSGQLEVYDGLENIKHENNVFSMQLAKERSISVGYLFNATGAGYDPAALPLFRNMTKRDLICPHPLGGISVHPQTLEVYNPKKGFNHKICAIGELTKGNCLATADMGRVAAQASKVATFTTHNLLASKFKPNKSGNPFTKEENNSHMPKASEVNFFKSFSTIKAQKAPIPHIRIDFRP